ncbi:MAG: HDOD domain-containing protein [Gammaproteobacteria bacterium]|nr:HDOD domain-containing protein [Gammaproteobacteria bacterium]
MGTAGIYSEIFASLASNQSLFPSLPEITIRLRATLNDPRCDIASAAKLLKTDPGLSAFIMRIANSVRYMSRFPPKDLEAALRRIGLEAASRLATTFAIRSSFETSNPVLKSMLVASYRNATKVSVISYFLAERFSGFDPSKAMLAGLLQDIALPPILLRLSERPDVFEDAGKRLRAVDQLAPLVGVLILKNWGFDDELIEVVRTRKDWMRDPYESADLSDIVIIARLHSMIGTSEFTDCPSFVQVPAFHKLPFGELTPGQSIKMLEDAQDELADIARLLGGG